VLAERLLELYPGEHSVTLYEASPYPVSDPVVRTMPLEQLATAELPSLATLYVPPAVSPRSDPSMVARLRLEPQA
jgi:hypothetical protein